MVKHSHLPLSYQFKDMAQKVPFCQHQENSNLTTTDVFDH